MAKRVLVTGDLIYDFNLIRMPMRPLGHHDPLPETVMHGHYGGAWYLAEMTRLACSDLSGECAIDEPGRPEKAQALGPGTWARAHTIWTPHFRVSGDKEKRRVWRITDFLGCEESKVEKATSIQFPADEPQPDLIMIEDLNLGFHKDKNSWPAELRNEQSNTAILLKTCGGLHDTPLWTELIEKHHAQLTVVLSLESLRDRHARISKALSWDRTIRELELEMFHGKSRDDLALASKLFIRIGAEGVAIFESGKFHRLVFDPINLEGAWRRPRPGGTFGATTILAAAVARHLVEPGTYPKFFAASRALQAMRVYHDIGGGPVKTSDSGEYENNFKNKHALSEMANVFHPSVETDEQTPKPVAAEGLFRCLVAPSLLDADSPLLTAPAQPSPPAVGGGASSVAPSISYDILEFQIGKGYECALVKAKEVVNYGIERALSSAPHVRFGDFFTVDRDEIERMNELGRLIRNYRDNPEDRKPLAIAVFGPPGSGKSFAIKELAKTISPDAEKATLQFNLSQFQARPEALHHAFHLVRDASLKGFIPLVFWDEFDTDKFSWLKHFLAPIQDAEFLEGGSMHSFGKAIFVFAGGTRHRFCDFNLQPPAIEECKAPNFEERQKAYGEFEEVKGPDFVSRLRAFVDIKGPNASELQTTGASCPKDGSHVIRRATMLRNMLERFCASIINPQTKAAAISEKVVQAFLRVDKFRHGARSMETIIRSSDLAHANFFNVDALPSKDLLDLHLSGDFMKQVDLHELSRGDIEKIARAVHEAWKVKKEGQGWTLADTRDDDKKTSPLLCPYEELTEEQREDNRRPVRGTLGVLHGRGYTINYKREPLTARHNVSRLPPKVVEELAVVQHDIWIRHFYVHGWEKADKTIEELRLHRDCAPLDEIPPVDKILDDLMVRTIFDTLDSLGVELVSSNT